MSTNWVIDLFDLIQESGGNLLTEDGDSLICLQEFNATDWTQDTTTGNG